MRSFAAVVLAGSAVLAAALSVRAQPTDLPAGWLRAGDHPAEYEMGMDPKGGKAGKICAFIRGRAADPQGFGTLMQMFDPGEYLGKRLRLSAAVKSAGITKWAGLWMRIDGTTPPGAQMPTTLGFDNMQGRPITGTADWTTHAIVLDVPAEARGIAFGILLSGPGQAWMDDLRLEAVGPDVPVTGMPVNAGPPPNKPNLTFEK
jgi:hypothetical protein